MKKEMTELDKQCVSDGFDHGNYVNAYITTDYSFNMTELQGANGFYRIGFLLGFFSSYELNEIYNPEHRSEVERYRKEFPEFE